jgi:hypothetical protein
LIGEPPNFQGVERYIVFLSMVCSPKSIPTQSQLFHAQRTNAALSRARHRMVLVRSIDVSDIPNADDIKIPIIKFFSDPTSQNKRQGTKQDTTLSRTYLKKIIQMIEKMLIEMGYKVNSLGVIWSNGICVEDQSTGQRSVVGIEGIGETKDRWQQIINEQKIIERVSWKTLRVGAASFIADHTTTLGFIEKFLSSAGVRKPLEDDDVDADNILFKANIPNRMHVEDDAIDVDFETRPPSNKC